MDPLSLHVPNEKAPDVTSPTSPMARRDSRQLHIDLEAQSPRSPTSPRSGPRRSSDPDLGSRKVKRSATSKSYRPKLAGRQWKPGQEPGIDPHGKLPDTVPVGLREECQITVVDFSQDDIEIRELDNEQLVEFLQEPKPHGLTCRWINVNGLSWDVISLLGREFKFHRLAVEDMLTRRNRTKADWYSDHTYMVLPLQKLVKLHEEDGGDTHSDDGFIAPGDSGKPLKKKKKGWKRTLARAFRGEAKEQTFVPHQATDVHTGLEDNMKAYDVTDLHMTPRKLKTRTLQRYHGGTNEERTDFMEQRSALRTKGLAVSVEQVSIFLTSNNTVIAFLEDSADDLELPIIQRLSSPETVLRRSSDGSMIVQAILDAIIDMAIPVTAAYKDAIDELELNVLTDPHIRHTKALYILLSEIASFRSTISPVNNLVNALRDHRPPQMLPATPSGMNTPNLGQLGGFPSFRTGSTGVTISPLAVTYLADVEDHVLLITENLDQMRRAADNMIDLIFNTISAFQNESMRQLTIITIFFLPLTFITSYFGMNFERFSAIHQFSDAFVWYVSAPVLTCVTVFLFRETIRRWFEKRMSMRFIKNQRKERAMARAKKRL